MPELTRQSLWCSQPEHRPTMSHQISQGRKKYKAWLGLEPRTSLILCEHSDYWATEPQSTCDTLYKLRSYYVFLNWIIWTKRRHYHQCKTKTSVNEKIHNSYFWQYIAKLQIYDAIECTTCHVTEPKFVKLQVLPVSALVISWKHWVPIRSNFAKLWVKV